MKTSLSTIFNTQRNCYRIESAGRAAFIIDGADYFRALRSSMLQARRSIFIAGWDFHSKVRLTRGRRSNNETPAELGKLLNHLAENRPGLRIYLLIWDFSMIYAAERELFSRYKLNHQTHERIQFQFDGEHPPGASHHQKIAVIDDAVAFTGGLDVTRDRWDTSEHRPRNRRRKNPRGDYYDPFHDVQMAVDGNAAKALGDIVKDRWRRAFGTYPEIDERIETGDPWPAQTPPDFRNLKEIAVARTMADYKDRGGIREGEQLFIDSIAAAREFIYIENQYLSAYVIGEALKKRLQEKNGPEIIIVLPRKTSGWLEQHTMDVLRARILDKLRDADRYGRLKMLAALIIGLAAIWRWTPAGDWMNVESVMKAAKWIQRQSFSPLLVIAGFTAGGFISFPVTLMMIGTVLIFGPWQGLIYSLMGAEISALIMFMTGRRLGRDSVRWFAGPVMNRLSEKLKNSNSAFLAVISFRIIPVAPFSLINIAAGVTEIRIRDFAVGTIAGMAPGAIAIALVSDRIAESFREPDLGAFAAVLGAVALAASGLFLLHRRFRRKSGL